VPIAALDFNVGIADHEIHAAILQIDLSFIGDIVVIKPTSKTVLNFARFRDTHPHKPFGMLALLFWLAFVPRVPYMVALLITKCVFVVFTGSKLPNGLTAVIARSNGGSAEWLRTFPRLRQACAGTGAEYRITAGRALERFATLLAYPLCALGCLYRVLSTHSLSAFLRADACFALLVGHTERLAAYIANTVPVLFSSADTLVRTLFRAEALFLFRVMYCIECLATMSTLIFTLPSALPARLNRSWFAYLSRGSLACFTPREQTPGTPVFDKVLAFGFAFVTFGTYFHYLSLKSGGPLGWRCCCRGSTQ
jgi:hypothetical protein